MSQNKLTILIIDDDEADRKLVKRMFKRAEISCHFVESDSVEKALKILEDQSFDCILIDYLMPKVNGIDGILEIKKILPTIPTIMMTSHGDEMIAASGIKSGATDYISKGLLSPESLKRTLESTLEIGALQRKLSEQRAELEGFTRVLVHDLRSPLIAIEQLAQSMIGDISSGSYEQLVEKLQFILTSTKQIDALIKTLHSFTKLDHEIDHSKVSLKKVIEMVIFHLSAEIEEGHAQVTFDHDIPEVYGIEPQLVQLIQNLVANGIKYNESVPPKVHISISSDDQYWIIHIQDNGIGIPRKYQKRIFEPFERLHTQQEYSGTGIGLFTCKKVVNRHRGKIWVDSDGESGTTFHFSLAKDLKPGLK